MHFLQQDFSVRFLYKIYFCKNIFSPENALLGDFLTEDAMAGTEKKILFIIDRGVLEFHGGLTQEIRDYFRQYPQIKPASELIILNGGEQVKNEPAALETVLAAINKYGIDRHSYLAVIGGGALLDLGGYAAAIAHRGIRLLRFPTTVLSQNDSGVGVKNGINYFSKKNFLGTFSTPAAVFNDEQFLLTLDMRNWRSGIAEAIKVALIKDADFFTWLEMNAARLVSRDAEHMNYLIHTCAKLHIDHISGADPFEKGSSRPLDFGHWAAHKIEFLSFYSILHGEAVAIGMAIDIIYSNLAGFLSTEKMQRILNLIVAFGFELYHPVLADAAAIFAGLDEFREHLGGRLTIMLINDIGTGFNIHSIDEALFNKSLELLENLAVSK